MEEFKKLSEMLEKIHNCFIKANQNFVIWKSLETLLNPDEIWLQNAQENLDTINRFKTFFPSVIDSCKNAYILELAKCFDTNHDALSIHKVLAFTRENITNLNYENYKKYKGKDLILEKWEYEPIDMIFLNWLGAKIKWKSKVIQRLMNFRNQYLGHNQLQPSSDSTITRGELNELMEMLMEIWNTISQKLLRTTWWHNFSDKQTYEEIERLLNFLHRFELYRLDEIQKESLKRLSDYNKLTEDQEKINT